MASQKKTVKKKEKKKEEKKVMHPNSLANLTSGRDNDDYKPEYCQEIVKYMSQGYSLSSYGATIGKTLQTLKNWSNKYPDFAEAHQLGKQSAMKFFEIMLVNASMGIIPDQLKRMGATKYEISAIIFALKTRFHKEYGEKTEINHRSEDGTMSPQKMTDEELAKKAKEYGIEQ